MSPWGDIFTDQLRGDIFIDEQHKPGSTLDGRHPSAVDSLHSLDLSLLAAPGRRVRARDGSLDSLSTHWLVVSAIGGGPFVPYSSVGRFKAALAPPLLDADLSRLDARA